MTASPLTVLICAAGFELGAERLRARGKLRLAALLYAGLGTGIAVFLLASKPAVYPLSKAREGAEAIEAAAPEDPVLIYPLSAYGFAFYSDHPVVLQATRAFAHNFELAFSEERLRVLSPASTAGPRLARNPEMNRALDAVLATAPKRVFVLGADGRQDPFDQGLAQAFQERGYQAEPRLPGQHRSLVTIFLRKP